MISSYKEENRKRLILLLSKIRASDSPAGWKKITSLAVGGLITAGFSKQQKHLLLIVSSSGRSLVDCRTGEKIDRNYEEYVGLNMAALTCAGIGTIKEEQVQIFGLGGGGLPQSNTAHETLELVSPNWPEQDLIFCQPFKNALIEGHQTGCTKIYSEHIHAFGFSWCGNFIIAGCGSDIDIWQRNIEL